MPGMKARRYTKVRRAEAENETRARIVEAMIALHEDVGPARTTVSAVAERAGVERLTVYRHFPDEASMIRACSSCWAEQHPLPEIPAKAGGDPIAVCRNALSQLYGWYRVNERMLERVHADRDRVASVDDALRSTDEYLDAVAAAMDRQWTGRSSRRAATLRHAVEFTTWRSLQRIAGSDSRAVGTVLDWLRAV